MSGGTGDARTARGDVITGVYSDVGLWYSGTTNDEENDMAIDHDALTQAEKDLEIGIAETLADMPDMTADDIWHDIVVAMAHDMNDDTAREWCRTQIGSIPYDLELRLGKRDWIR